MLSSRVWAPGAVLVTRVWWGRKAGLGPRACGEYTPGETVVLRLTLGLVEVVTLSAASAQQRRRRLSGAGTWAGGSPLGAFGGDRGERARCSLRTSVLESA